MNQKIENENMTLVTFSKTQVKKAGKAIISSTATVEQKEKAKEIIDFWRSLHAYPLELILESLNNISMMPKEVVIAQRLKRLESITSKLFRMPTMNLCIMQDIAGCRIIVEDIEDVYFVVNLLKDEQTFPFTIHTVDDYIESSKPSGYRGIHCVFNAQNIHNSCNYNLFIEIQVRTRLEHIWATAVETMGLYTHSDLKAGEGPCEILKFFEIVSNVFEMIEKKEDPRISRENFFNAFSELSDLNNRFNIIRSLEAISVISSENENLLISGGYYLLDLNYKRRKLSINHFQKDQYNRASELYSQLETKYSNTSSTVVLISSTSFINLKEAYPNYFNDISAFNRIVLTMCWNLQILHSGDPVLVEKRREINEALMSNSVSIKKFFSICTIDAICDDNSLPEGIDGVGSLDGKAYYIMSSGPRLSDSYLRFSAIKIKDSILPSNLSQELPEFHGKAIIITAKGGTYYVDKANWSILPDDKCFVIQLLENQDIRLIYILLSWLKSSAFFWYYLWSGKKTLLVDIPCKLLKAVYSSQYDLLKKNIDDILDIEYSFVKDFTSYDNLEDNEVSKLIKQHNESADNYAGRIDCHVFDILEINKTQTHIIEDDLSKFYVYQFNL